MTPAALHIIEAPRPCEVCGVDLNTLGKRADAKVCGGACRAERSRRVRGVRYVAKAHSTAARRVKRAPELRISYRRAVAALTDEFGVDDGRIAATLGPLLSPAARKHLDRKDHTDA